MLKKLYLVACLLVILGISSCKKEPNDDVLVVNVEDDFYIKINQEVVPEGRLVRLDVKTIRNQPCSNYSIAYEAITDIGSSYQRIIVSLNELMAPDDCIEIEAPAEVSIPLGVLDENNYSLRINLTDAVINTGVLDVSSSDYEIRMVSDYGFELQKASMKRIPEAAIWGYVTYDDNGEADNADVVIKALEDLDSTILIADSELLEDGYYGNFEISDGDMRWENATPDADFVKYFVMEFQGEESSSLRTVVDSYCNLFPNLGIQLFDGNGEAIICE